MTDRRETERESVLKRVSDKIREREMGRQNKRECALHRVTDKIRERERWVTDRIRERVSVT